MNPCLIKLYKIWWDQTGQFFLQSDDVTGKNSMTIERYLTKYQLLLSFILIFFSKIMAVIK